MILTVDAMRAAYAYLAETEPFKDWNLHDAEDVEFKVTRIARVYGETHTTVRDDGKFEFTIDLSGVKHTHTASIMVTMAHEMVHVHQRHNCINLTNKAHGADFHALAAEVCTAHGFDPGQF